MHYVYECELAFARDASDLGATSARAEVDACMWAVSQSVFGARAVQRGEHYDGIAGFVHC